MYDSVFDAVFTKLIALITTIERKTVADTENGTTWQRDMHAHTKRESEIERPTHNEMNVLS